MRTLIMLGLLALFGAAPAGTAGSGPVEEFRPSTRLPVDQAIAFPVDI